MSLANSLRYRVLRYNKFGSEYTIQKAQEIFDKITKSAIGLADQGKNCIIFNEKDLPKRCVNYFKYLCKCEELTLEEIGDKPYDGLSHYIIRWD